MRTIKLIAKGVLLWITILAVVLYISGIDSIIDNGFLIGITLSIVIMCFACYKLIDGDELEVLLLYKWYNELIGGK